MSEPRTRIVNLEKDNHEKLIIEPKFSVPCTVLSVPVAGILELPNVIFTKVFQFLKAEDLCEISCVNKRMKMICEDDCLWKTQFENTYGKLGNTKLRSETYKEAFVFEYGMDYVLVTKNGNRKWIHTSKNI